LAGSKKRRSVTFQEVRAYQDKIVILYLSDGEVTNAKIQFADAEHEDIVVDIISTNRPDRYRTETKSAFAIRAADLISIKEIAR
jgi:hypothetical protein